MQQVLKANMGRELRAGGLHPLAAYRGAGEYVPPVSRHQLAEATGVLADTRPRGRFHP
jgi:hypothetical protein